ncbi:MAG: alanine--glyoxylate aminotransferase family protein [Chloroflexi bacterium]|nr:alanine--glyoxylate aminotransferase family protein [Chloroflexota bacterium]
MKQLRIPGPTPCPDKVLQAMSRQMVNHRGVEFARTIENTTAKLKQVFQTANDVLLLTGSGTGGMEAAIVNTLSPGDKVLAVTIGVFGDRFANIARQFGAEVTPLSFEWGRPADPDAVRSALNADPGIKAVLVTHNETSTGVTNDLAAISAVVKEFDKLLLVDAISSLSSIDLPVDDWHCDVVVSGSQKGWMVPPGLAMVSVSPEAWKAHAAARMPRFYWDFTRAKKFLEKKQTPWTPAVSLVFALDVALDMMLEEGLASIIERHARVGRAAREGAKGLGLSLFADEKYASNTVTAISAANGLDAKKLVRTLREEHKVELSGGQQSLEGKIFRIGHLGWVTEKDIAEVISALEITLPRLGFVPAGLR